MKNYIKIRLQEWGLYYKLKYSKAFEIYQRMFKRYLIKQHKKEVQLYKGVIGKCDLIFDIGAYDGHKTAAFAEIAERVISCEPDPLNYQILLTRFKRNKRVTVLNTAVFNSTSEAILQRNDQGSAFSTLSRRWTEILETDNEERWNAKIAFDAKLAVRVKTTTLDELINKFGIPDFVKIDVEGSELQVFQGLSYKISAISFECLLPEYSEELNQILQILIQFDDRYRFNVIYEEELLLPGPVTYMQISEWSKTTNLFSFDILATLK